MQKVTFPNKILPYFLLAPQIVLTVVFFFWPASQAIYQSFMREDAFGLKSTFVELANFTAVLSDPNYLHSVQVTVVFNVLTALLAMGVALTGLTSFVSHSGAPPFQMYVLPQHLEKLVFAGTSTILFAIVNAVKLVPYWELNQFSNLDLSLGLWLVPAAVIGTYAGAIFTRIMSDGPFFLLVQLTLFGLSIKLVADWIVPFFFA